MKRRISLLLRGLWLAQICLTPPALAEIGPYPPKLSPDGKLGIMGDSLALGIHASEMCGNDDAYQCAQQTLGTASPDWSYVAADKTWSIASLLGFDTAHRVVAFDGGEEWKDALDQAMTIMTDPLVEAVFIGLGANNVCTPRGHDYTDDLVKIAGEIDTTLTYLTDTLPVGGRIYWSGVLDVLQLHELMRRRDHNYWFETCQGTWDLDANKIKDGAANDVCDHFFNHTACQLTSSIEEAKDELMKLLFNKWLDLEGVDEGPCGKILSSRSTDADRAEAREFNLALNQLMSDKAAQYDGRNGVAVYYSDRIFDATANLRPYHVSRLDCFHPSRAGQMYLANETWRGFDPFAIPVSRYYFDEFDSQNYCAQEFTAWDSCWNEINENNGPTAGDIRINVHELRVRDKNKGIMRSLNLDGMEAAWLQFNWRREGLDNNDDNVSIDVSPDAGMTWYQQKLIKGDGDDYNMHRGYYCDITPYATADTLLRFKSSRDMGDHDEVFFDNITVLGWGSAADYGADKRLFAGLTPDAVNSQFHAVDFPAEMSDTPVVIISLQTFEGADTAGLRLRNLNTGAFEIKIEEEQSLDGETGHINEVVGYLALQTGLIYDIAGSVVGEADTLGTNQIGDNQWHTVSLQGVYADPVVLMNMTTYNGSQPSHLRLRNITSSSFEYQIEEWDYLDQSHTTEDMGFVVLESGIHNLPDGTQIEAGVVQSNHLWVNALLSSPFTSSPVILSQSQTTNGGQAVITRQRNITSTGFEVRLQEEEGNDGWHQVETIGYVAVSP
jgi:hypothetical protein